MAETCCVVDIDILVFETRGYHTDLTKPDLLYGPKGSTQNMRKSPSSEISDRLMATGIKV